MNKPTIDYNTLTEEQLEEYAEFVDWSLVPVHLLTEDINKLFDFFPHLKIRLWFEDLLSKMDIKEDQEKYPNELFFFVGNDWFMDLSLKSGDLWFSDYYIWSVFEKKHGFSYSETQMFIKNVIEMHFKNMTVTPLMRCVVGLSLIEKHFKNKEVTPTKDSSQFSLEIEMHFKNMVVTPKRTTTPPLPVANMHFKNYEKNR